MHSWNSTSLLQPHSVLNNHKRVDAGFFTPLFATFPTAMISWDVTIAGTTFLVFLIHQSRKKNFKIFKYVIALFMVGFSLALPLYLYDNESFERLN